MRFHTSLIATLIAASTFAGQSDAQTSCRSANAQSDQFKGVITRMMDSDMADFRATYSMPLVTASQIALVADSAVCVSAGQAMDALASTMDPTPRPAATIPLWVYQIGTSYYAVVDTLSPNDNDADFIYLFDSSWNFKGFSFVQ